MRSMQMRADSSHPAPGDTVTVGDLPAVVEDIDDRGRCHARLANGAVVTGTIETQDKSWPPAGMESKVSPGHGSATK